MSAGLIYSLLATILRDLGENATSSTRDSDTNEVSLSFWVGGAFWFVFALERDPKQNWVRRIRNSMGL